MKKCIKCNKGEMILVYRRRDDNLLNICDYCGYTTEDIEYTTSDERIARPKKSIICLVCCGSGTSFDGNRDCTCCGGTGYVNM